MGSRKIAGAWRVWIAGSWRGNFETKEMADKIDNIFSNFIIERGYLSYKNIYGLLNRAKIIEEILILTSN